MRNCSTVNNGTRCVGLLFCVAIFLLVVPNVCASRHDVKIHDIERQPDNEGEWPVGNPFAESSVVGNVNENQNDTNTDDEAHDSESSSSERNEPNDDALMSSFGGMESSLMPSPPTTPPESEEPNESSVGMPPDQSGLPSESESSHQHDSQTATQSISASSTEPAVPEAPLSPTASETISPTESAVVPPSVNVEFTILGLSREAFNADVELEMRTAVAQAAGVTTNDVEILSVVQQEGFLGKKFRAMEGVRVMRGLEVTLYVVAKISHVSREMATQVVERIQNEVKTLNGFEVRGVALLPPYEPPTSPTQTSPQETATLSETKTMAVVTPTPVPPPLPPTGPGQVDLQIVVVVAADQFTAAEQAVFIAELARVLGVDPSQIQVIRIDIVDLDDQAGKRLRWTNARRHVVINDASSSEGGHRKAVSIEARVSGLPPSQTAENTSQIIQTAVNSNNGHLGAFSVSSITARDNTNQLPNSAIKLIGFHYSTPIWVATIVGIVSFFMIC